MRWLAILSLFAALGATGGAQTVTVAPSSIGFKEALAACPAGTLAAISLTLGHMRVAESANVDSDVDAQNVSSQMVSLTSGSRSATAKVNGSKNTVSAKHVTLSGRDRVACVAPD
jgi:hypothetical protein